MSPQNIRGYIYGYCLQCIDMSRSDVWYWSATVWRWNGCCRDAAVGRRLRGVWNGGHVDLVVRRQRDADVAAAARRRCRHPVITDSVPRHRSRPLPGGTRPRPRQDRRLEPARVQARLSEKHRQPSQTQHEARLQGNFANVCYVSYSYILIPPSHSCLLCLQWMSGVV